MTTQAQSTQVDIINLALGHIAMRPIAAIDDATPEAVAASRVWLPALREALRSHDWGFATVVEPLIIPADSDDWATNHAYVVGDYVIHSDTIYYCLTDHTSETFATDLAAVKWEAQEEFTPVGWSYGYAYPVNFLAVWHVYDEYETNKDIGQPFREIYDSVNDKKVIVTNVQEAYAEGTYFMDNTALFNATFVTALGYRLAAELAIILTGNIALNKQMIILFNNAIGEAERMSSYENNPGETPPNPIVDSRS